MAGMPDRWFVAPAGIVDGLYLPGFSAEDANPDIGDSTITESAGIGGFAGHTAGTQIDIKRQLLAHEGVEI